MTADDNTTPLDPSVEDLVEDPDEPSGEVSGTKPASGTSPENLDVDLDSDIAIDIVDEPGQGEATATQIGSVEAVGSSEDEESVHRWWRDGPNNWISALMLTEVITAVVIGLLFLGVTEIREGERQQRAEQLENLRFVRTAVAGQGEKQSRQFSGLDLARTDLSGLDLSGANLTGANLFGANLTKAYLSRANLTETNLSAVNLSEGTLF